MGHGDFGRSAGNRALEFTQMSPLMPQGAELPILLPRLPLLCMCPKPVQDLIIHPDVGSCPLAMSYQVCPVTGSVCELPYGDLQPKRSPGWQQALLMPAWVLGDCCETRFSWGRCTNSSPRHRNPTELRGQRCPPGHAGKGECAGKEGRASRKPRGSPPSPSLPAALAIEATLGRGSKAVCAGEPGQVSVQSSGTSSLQLLGTVLSFSIALAAAGSSHGGWQLWRRLLWA